jgi:hypothetical protein
VTFRFSFTSAALLGLVCLLQLGCAGSTAESGAVSPPPPAGSSKIIDRTNFNQIETANSAALQKLAKLRVFFAHASVGGNMVQGLQALNQADSSRYPLTIAQGGASTGSPGTPGTLYEFDRGNPGQAAKISQFAESVNSGWASPNVDVVISKFCYIDPDADFDAYTSSMQALERAHPGTVVVYATIPICSDQSNDQREVFNEKLRAWCKANKKPLLDIADIEAGQADGTARVYSSGGKSVRQMVEGYTSDGGHLNDAGAKRVAEGLYSLLVSVAP